MIEKNDFNDENEMYKKFNLSDESVLILQINPGYACPIVMINGGYIKDNSVYKDYRLSIWDDIQFSAYSDDINASKVEFEFDITHPLYFCFNRFLDSDQEFIIDDDHTYGSMRKYLVFKRDDKKIKMIFVNNTEEKQLHSEIFGTFIKNIGPDPRSKIRKWKTKKRIIDFFRDMEKVLKEEYHQITFDEYIETLDQSDEFVPVLRMKR